MPSEGLILTGTADEQPKFKNKIDDHGHSSRDNDSGAAALFYLKGLGKGLVSFYLPPKMPPLGNWPLELLFIH